MSVPAPAPQPRRFALAELAPTPWKNGGGTTREIAAWPPAAGLEAFDWRLSVADIAADGPFSAFPGIDRQIVLLDGDGVRLRARDGSFDHRLTVVGEPFAFAGEAALDATLLVGPTRDFNVMTRRGRCRATVFSTGGAFDRTEIEAGTTVMVFVLAGVWRCDDARGAAGDPLTAGAGMLLPPGTGEGAYRWQPQAEGARALVVELQTLSAAAAAVSSNRETTS